MTSARPRQLGRRAVSGLAGAVMLLAGCSSGSGPGNASTGAGGAAAAGATAATAAGTAGTAPGPAARPSPGCGTSTAGAVTNERRTVQAAGEERWYLLTVPGAHDGRTPLPLVVDFHGLAEGAQLHGAATRFSELGATEGFVVATPNGRFEPVRWDANPNSASNADLAYVTTLLDTLGRDLCLDTSRVYATGLSMGAMMDSLLACRMADRFAAVAPVAGINDVEPCPASRAMPVLTFHGTADPILPFNGGVGDIVGKLLTGTSSGGPATTLPPVDLNGPGYPTNVAGWAARNGCEATPTDTKVSETLIHRVYRCPAGAEVEFYIVQGGGHTWPGSPVYKAMAGIMGPTSDEIDATAEAWRFFQRHRLP